MDMTRFETARPKAWQINPVSMLAGSLLLLANLAGCTPLSEEGSSILRGDQAFANGDVEEALAEYRLALRQGASDAGTYARVAHTYVALKRIDEAREYYRLAVAQDSILTDQALSDFVHLAREEDRIGDRYGMATAVETAIEFRPGVSFDDLALSLAQHYADVGEYGRALPFYQKALSAIEPDSMPRLVFEAAVAYDEVGDCETAVIYYEQYREYLPPQRRTEVHWRLGHCSFELAQTSLDEEDEEEALRHVEVLLEIEEPRNLLARGYFMKGEILGRRGECEAAIEAFQRVPVEDPSGTSAVVDSAELRIDQIRFGGRFDRSFQRLRAGMVSGSCFPPDPPTRGGGRNSGG
ncbi:MAG: tetratricopeptide repeat protein [Gemmatimonadota bacterium]